MTTPKNKTNPSQSQDPLEKGDVTLRLEEIEPYFQWCCVKLPYKIEHFTSQELRRIYLILKPLDNMEMKVPALVTKEKLIKLVGRVEKGRAKELQEREEELDRAKTFLQSLIVESTKDQSTPDTSNAPKKRISPSEKKEILDLWSSEPTMANPSKDHVWKDQPERILKLFKKLSD